MSAVGGNGLAMAKAINDLLAHWDQTAASWKDQARDHFYRDHIEALAPAVRQASNAIQEIEEILRKIRKDCA